MIAVRRAALLASLLAAVGGSACKPNAVAEEKFRPIAVGEPVPEMAVRTLQGE